MEHIICCTPSFQGTRIIAEKDMDNLEEPEEVNELKEIVSSEHNRSVAHVKSKQLWEHT